MTASETQTAQSADAPEHITHDHQPVVALTLTFLAIISGNETPIRSAAIRGLYLIALSAPFFILSTTAIRRRFFSAPIPARLAPEAAFLRRLNGIGTAILISSLLCLAFSIMERPAVGLHNPRYTVSRDFFWFLTAWWWMLTAYISDRKPLPPPREPSFTWAGMKPIHSDHWRQPVQR